MSEHQTQTLNTKLSTQPQNTVTNTKPIPHSHTQSTVYQNLQQTGVANFAPTASNTTTSVDQIAEALAKVKQLPRLPQAKSDIFTCKEKDIKFFIWETAFDVVIDAAPISARQKLDLLFQHLEGKAKLVVEQLQYIVAADRELTYVEARKNLKERFGRRAIIATDFENKLSKWQKLSSNDARGIREFSDFLQQVVTATLHLPSLKIFEYPSKLQTLVEKLPNWFQTKWSAKVQTLQEAAGQDKFPVFKEFVKEVTFHADRMNIPQIAPQSPSNDTTKPRLLIATPHRRGITMLTTKSNIQKSNATRKSRPRPQQRKTLQANYACTIMQRPTTSAIAKNLENLTFQKGKNFLRKIDCVINAVCKTSILLQAATQPHRDVRFVRSLI